MSILNKDLMGELHDMVGDELNFLTYVKKNNIKVRNGIKWDELELNWNLISCKEELTEEMIRVFHDRLNWHRICKCQRLTEDFINEFIHKVDWIAITHCQMLSEEFIIKHKIKHRVRKNKIIRKKK